ncbi:MAG: hypothetical protein WAO91_01710 [Candidatus Nitrosotenuis sp.]
MNSSLDEIKELVKYCLNQLYSTDAELFRRNNGEGISERSIGFRFAHYLQNKIKDDFFVDCDFNSSDRGNNDTAGKPIPDPEGGETGRFIDIIVHKRELGKENNLVCFEIKKWKERWDDRYRDAIEKDRNNLHELTLKEGRYGYRYGFHILIRKDGAQSKWTIYENGDPIPSEQERII